LSLEKSAVGRIQLMRLLQILFWAVTGLAALSAQPVPRVSPEAAADHLARKVDPVYPAFARAAGVEGVVRYEVSISTKGHVYGVMKVSGPPSLDEAAVTAMGQYVYRPFEENGRAVNVATTVDVVFRLGEGVRTAAPYPVEKVSLDRWRDGQFGDFTAASDADSASTISPNLRSWLRSDAATCGKALPWSGAELAEKRKACLDALKIIELPVKRRGVRLFFASPIARDMCGASGNCEIDLVEEDATGVHPIADANGWGFYAHFRAGSAYPDIFVATHVSSRETSVTGYVNASGFWGPLYCGSIQSDYQGKETAEIQVCR